MKKILSLLLIICSIILVACNNPESKLEVTNCEVSQYQEKIVEGEMFDESSVVVNVHFSDGTNKTYYSGDIRFNYRDFDSYTPGEYTIKAVITEIDHSFEFVVEVVRKSFKVLMIGNSFADDTIQWIHEICDDLGIDFTIANMYIGGCVLSTHLDNLKNDKKAYEYVSYNKLTNKWSRIKNISISEAIDYDDWNYISLQQGSSQSGLAYTYDDIDEVMDYILKLKSDVKFVWNMTWAYQQDSGHASFGTYNNNQMDMYNSILTSVCSKVLPNERFECVIPNGTAVQNARTSFVGDNLCRDIFCHLTYDFGRYIAGLTFVAAITGADIFDVKYSPNLDERYVNVAKESAINAINNPYTITQSIYK